VPTIFLSVGTLRFAHPTSSIQIFKQQKKSRDADGARVVPGRRPRNTEGAGKTGCALHPRSRVQIRNKRKRTRAYRFSGNTPAFPAQWFYDLLRALPGDRAFLPPSLCELAKLSASVGAPGPHDFAVRSSHARQSQLLASTASRPNVRHDGQRPSYRGQDGGVLDSIWAGGKGKYFFEQDWTGQISLNRFKKSGFWRRGYLPISPGRKAYFL
jgi:hypothetical protein